MNSSNFYLAEIEELKGCISLVEADNAGIGQLCFWHHPFLELLEKTLLFRSKKVFKFLTFFDGSLQSVSNFHTA